MHGRNQIIRGEVLLTRPLESDTPDLPARPRTMSRLARFGKYALTYSLCMVAYNGAILHDKFHTQGTRDDIQMIEDAELCEPFDYVEMEPDTGEVVVPQGFTEEQAEETLSTEAIYAPTTSAAYNLKPARANPLKSIDQLINVNSHEFDSFTSRHSGLNVHLYSDREDPFESVDLGVIDDLLHASLDESIEFDHITVAQFMECARDQVLLSRGGSLLKGERLNIYIASQAGVCWSNGRVQEYPYDSDVSFKDFCDSNGFTIKDFDLQIVPGILSHSQSWLAVTTHRRDFQQAEKRISQMLMHEFIHFYQQALGLPFKYNPNERLADHIEDETIVVIFLDSFPVAVKFKPHELHGDSALQD